MDETWVFARITSCSRHVGHDAVAMATAVALQPRIEHTAVWSSGGRKLEPILIKYGAQQQLW